MGDYRINDQVREFDASKAFKKAMLQDIANDADGTDKRARRRAQQLSPEQFHTQNDKDGFRRREPSVASMTKGRSFRVT